MTLLALLVNLGRRGVLATILAAALGGGNAAAQAPDPLPSWNDGAVKKSITDFIPRVTAEGGADFVPLDQRIATFDNDGTLWCERDGRVVLVRQATMLGSPNEGPPKAVNIQAHIGRRPILAAGNSAGDREMLEYAHTGDHLSLCLVVDHDDAEREYAYACASATDPDAESILDTASRLAWTVVSMRRDWNRVFAG